MPSILALSARLSSMPVPGKSMTPIGSTSSMASLRLNATCGTLRLADGQPVVVRTKVTRWAADLSAKGGAEGACRLIADRGRHRLQGRRVPPEHGFGQGHAPIHHILHRRHPDLLAEALAEYRAG